MEFRDLKTQYRKLKPEISMSILDVMNNTNFILGQQVFELEEKLAKYVGRKHCISCANGTDALYLALMVMGVKKGDAVFVPNFTYIASASTVSLIGATPIFVDIDINTFNISVSSLEYQIKKVIKEGKLNPKAILPVDLFGQCCEYDKINEIAKKYNLLVIEDAAQGFGGSIKGKMACSFGDISCTSFFPAKPLGCYGDGGAIFTDSDEVEATLKSLRANGKSPYDKYDNIMIGTNSRLDTLQAAILLPKFKAFVEYELKCVNIIASQYNELLRDKVVIPTVLDGYTSSWAQYTILLKDEEERQKVKEYLKEKEIPSMIYYPRTMHQQKCYSDFNITNDEYPNSVEATKRVLSLPMHPYMQNNDINNICDSLVDFFK